VIFPLLFLKKRKKVCLFCARRVVERGRRSGVNDTSYTVVFGDGVFYNEKRRARIQAAADASALENEINIIKKEKLKGSRRRKRRKTCVIRDGCRLC
jgi:hypothetical protein